MDRAMTTELEQLTRGRIDGLAETLAVLRGRSSVLVGWGMTLAERLCRGRRLLAAGNGGSAAEAQHLTAELVGRFDRERPPFSAIALHSDTSSLTAIGNDYGYEQVFARQVTAHAAAQDVLVLLSTSGRSRNLVLAAAAGKTAGATVWALTGPGPNPLAEAADEAICLPGGASSVQEAHLVALHALCGAFECALAAAPTLPRLIRRAS